MLFHRNATTVKKLASHLAAFSLGLQCPIPFCISGPVVASRSARPASVPCSALRMQLPAVPVSGSTSRGAKQTPLSLFLEWRYEFAEAEWRYDIA